jgi:hypothetical protein
MIFSINQSHMGELELCMVLMVNGHCTELGLFAYQVLSRSKVLQPPGSTCHPEDIYLTSYVIQNWSKPCETRNECLSDGILGMYLGECSGASSDYDMYSMVQKNPNSDFILKATYPVHSGKLCLTFGPNFGGLGTKRKVGRQKKG